MNIAKVEQQFKATPVLLFTSKIVTFETHLHLFAEESRLITLGGREGKISAQVEASWSTALGENTAPVGMETHKQVCDETS